MTFNYLNCDECRKPMDHPALQNLLRDEETLRKHIINVAVKAARDDPNLIKNFTKLYSRNPSEAEKKCLEELAILRCVDCKQYFSGGKIQCAEMLELDSDNVRCEKCSWNKGIIDHRCFNHGYKYAIYKCDSCCDVATFHCSTNHYCTRCHNQAGKRKNCPCPGQGKCRLGMPHPKNVEAVHGNTIDGFVIGCVKCIQIENVKLSSTTSSTKSLPKIEQETSDLGQHQAEVWKTRFEKSIIVH